MIVRFSLELLLAFVVVLFGRLAWYLRRQVRFPAERTLEETIPFLRPVDRDEVEELADPEQERRLRLNLGERQFAREQKKRQARMTEQMDRMVHNAAFLRELARRERRTAVTLGDPRRQATAEKLVSACIEVRGGVYAIQLALFERRTRAAFYLPAKPFWLSSLRRVGPFDFVYSYERMAEAAVELCQSAPEDLRMALEQRL